MIKILLIPFILYLAFILCLFVFQRKIMYQPKWMDRPYPTGHAVFNQVQYDTEDDLTLTALWGEAKQDSAPTVIMFHGNAASASIRTDRFEGYVAQGFNVLLAEYRGYGPNEGQPTEQGLYRDARAAIQKVRSLNPESGIILYGESLGSGVATQMALEMQQADAPATAIILEVPYSSTLDVATDRFPLVPFMHLLFKDQFRSDLRIGKITAPKLIGIADQDLIIPPQFGLKLYDLAAEPKELIRYPAAAHMDLPVRGFDQEVWEFIEGNQ